MCKFVAVAIHVMWKFALFFMPDFSYFFNAFQIMGNSSEFKRAVQLVIDNVSFDKDNTVQVFEANIR